MSGKVIQGTFLCGRPAIRTPAPPPPRQPGPPLPAHVAQPRTAQPQVPGGVMPQRPGPPAPAFVAQPRAAQPQVPGGVMPQRPGPPAPAFAAQPRPVQPLAAGGAVAVDAALLRPTGRPGSPLPDALQRKMEQAFAADFSGVRVHEGPQAESIGAIAFTVGNDIWFAPGRFQPHTAAGQQLLGHELAHVLQQRAGRVRNPLGSGLAVVQDRALEAEADRMGHRAAAQMMPAAAPAAQVKAAQAQPQEDYLSDYGLTQKVEQSKRVDEIFIDQVILSRDMLLRINTDMVVIRVSLSPSGEPTKLKLNYLISCIQIHFLKKRKTIIRQQMRPN